jgi:O-acetylhomoserine/O-acetylserine sulfhydrylase-like pyridoxal-dependent enzyme
LISLDSGRGPGFQNPSWINYLNLESRKKVQELSTGLDSGFSQIFDFHIKNTRKVIKRILNDEIIKISTF